MLIATASKFKKDRRRAKKRGKDIENLRRIVNTLASEKELHPMYKEHLLTGNWVGHRECHIEPDWLLIYRIDRSSNTLVLVRTGTHSDLFD